MGDVTKTVKKPVKIILGGAASIGAGAVIGLALRYVPRNQLGTVARLCSGIGISGLAMAAGEISRKAIEENVDKAFAGLEVLEGCIDAMNAVKQMKAEMKADAAAEEDDEEEEEVDPLS